MIADLGFDIVSDQDLAALLAREPDDPEAGEQLVPLHALKTRKDLRPTL